MVRCSRGSNNSLLLVEVADADRRLPGIFALRPLREVAVRVQGTGSRPMTPATTEVTGMMLRMTRMKMKRRMTKIGLMSNGRNGIKTWRINVVTKVDGTRPRPRAVTRGAVMAALATAVEGMDGVDLPGAPPHRQGLIRTAIVIAIVMDTTERLLKLSCSRTPRSAICPRGRLHSRRLV